MIEMGSQKWNEKIKNNFNDAAYRYLEHSNIQKFFAKKIVQFIKELNPPKKGEWIDLGSGPGPAGGGNIPALFNGCNFMSLI